MCFSASASFAASAFLGLGGLALLSRTRDKSQSMFAAIPLLFGMQQATEGLVWLSFSYPSLAYLQNTASYLFLGFAFVFWPVWVPASLLLMETDRLRKRLLAFLLLASSNLALYGIIVFVCYGASTSIVEYHVRYCLYIPTFLWQPGIIMYLAATIVPFFVSSIRRMWVLGCILAASYLISFYFYYHILISVWCFFAAVLSTAIFIFLR